MSPPGSSRTHVHYYSWCRQMFTFFYDLHNLFQTQAFTDIELAVTNEDTSEGRNFKAHKVILCSISPVLRGQLEAQPQMAKLKLSGDIGTFGLVLDFIYSGILKYEEKDAKQLKHWAEILDMPRLNQLIKSPGYTHCSGCELQEGFDSEDYGGLEEGGSLLDEVDPLSNLGIEMAYDEEKSEEDDPGLWGENALFLTPELILKEEDSGDMDNKLELHHELGIRKHPRARRAKPTKPKVKIEPSKSIPSPKTSLKGEKNYLCSLCGRTLRGLTAYKRHLVIHSGLRPYACDTCGKDFTQKQRLVVHQRIHTGERPYLCSLCGKTFTESCKLNRHLKKVHKANKDGSELFPGQPVINTAKHVITNSDNSDQKTEVLKLKVKSSKIKITPKGKSTTSATKSKIVKSRRPSKDVSDPKPSS